VSKGLVTGVQLETVLRELSRVPGYRQFDELPIPYRAVATDLVTGKAVIFSSEPLPSYELFRWGGFLKQSGYATGQLVGPSLQFGQLVYFHRIVRSSLFQGAYGGVSLEAGQYGTPLVPNNPSGFLKSLALFVTTDTPIGPVYFGYGRAADGQGSFYFYLGLPM